MLNQYYLQGRLCAEPEQKIDIDGAELVTFNLAVPRNRRFNGVLYTDFIQCRAKGRTAELLLSSVQAGQEIIVKGCVRSRCQRKPGAGRQRSEQYLHVEQVFFSRPKTPGEVDAERTTEEVVDFPENMDGIDESGLFPETEDRGNE